jgi:hypothetical protein
MKKILIILATVVTLISCKKESLEPKETCPGGCYSDYIITSPSSTLQSDGYWHVSYLGANYFTIKGNLSQLDVKYVVNGVPLIEVNFDSDYWVIFDTIQYTTPMYSYLGWFTNNQFNTPISIGGYTYTLKTLAEIQPPLNIAGYQLSPYMCWDCPYTSTLLGTHSKYTYTPQQNFFFDNEMIGDTARIYIQTIFNSDIGLREEKNTILKVIFE